MVSLQSLGYSIDEMIFRALGRVGCESQFELIQDATDVQDVDPAARGTRNQARTLLRADMDQAKLVCLQRSGTNPDFIREVECSEDEANPGYYLLPQEFAAWSMYPTFTDVLINENGDPVYQLPANKITCFLASHTDSRAQALFNDLLMWQFLYNIRGRYAATRASNAIIEQSLMQAAMAYDKRSTRTVIQVV